MKRRSLVGVVRILCALSAVGCAAADGVGHGVRDGGRTVMDDGCPRTTGESTIVDYVPFVQLNDRMYIEVFAEADEQQLEAAELGARVAETQCKLSDVVNDPYYRARNGDAAFLEPGTKLFMVKGFDPGFRLAARVDGELQLYEADTVPGANRGGDLLGDIAGKVTAITVNSGDDGETVLGRIAGRQRVDELVGMVLDAEIDEDARPQDNGLRYFLEFELPDTPPVKMVLFVGNKILGRGIRVPEEFVATMQRALRTATDPGDRRAHRRALLVRDDEVEALFAVAPDEFTAARDGLVKRLRAAGEREAAKTVAGLRRPKLAAWAVNHLTRTDPAAVEALLEAGAAVQEQQRRLLSGVKAPQLRVASAARRAAIEELVTKAVAALEQQGVSPQAHVGEITATLEAASADEEAGQRVVAGRLSSPLVPPSGLEDLSALSALSLVAGEEDSEAPDPRLPPEDKRRRGDQLTRRRRAEEALREAQAVADEAEAACKQARDEMQASTREAGAAGRAAEEAEAAARAARGEADRLSRAAREAEARTGWARAALEVTEEKVAAMRGRAEEAQRALEQLD